MKSWFTTPLLLFLALGVAVAQETEEADTWSGKAGLGLAATTGNSDTSNLAADFTVRYQLERWLHELSGAAFRATSTDQTTDVESTTAERYKLGYKAQWALAEHEYLFGRLNFERDLFSGFKRQVSETVGYGRRVINRRTHVLNLEGGAGAKQSQLQDGNTEDELIVRLGGDYTWKFSDTGTFIQRLATEIGSENTYTEWVSEVKATLVRNIGLALSYTVKNNSDVPVGSEKTDTYTTISLQYEF